MVTSALSTVYEKREGRQLRVQHRVTPLPYDPPPLELGRHFLYHPPSTQYVGVAELVTSYRQFSSQAPTGLRAYGRGWRYRRTDVSTSHHRPSQPGVSVGKKLYYLVSVRTGSRYSKRRVYKNKFAHTFEKLIAEDIIRLYLRHNWIIY